MEPSVSWLSAGCREMYCRLRVLFFAEAMFLVTLNSSVKWFSSGGSGGCRSMNVRVLCANIILLYYYELKFCCKWIDAFCIRRRCSLCVQALSVLKMAFSCIFGSFSACSPFIFFRSFQLRGTSGCRFWTLVFTSSTKVHLIPFFIIHHTPSFRLASTSPPTSPAQQWKEKIFWKKCSLSEIIHFCK